MQLRKKGTRKLTSTLLCGSKVREISKDESLLISWITL